MLADGEGVRLCWSDGMMADRIVGSELVGGNGFAGLPITECDADIITELVTIRNNVCINPVVFSREEFMQCLLCDTEVFRQLGL